MQCEQDKQLLYDNIFVLWDHVFVAGACKSTNTLTAQSVLQHEIIRCTCLQTLKVMIVNEVSLKSLFNLSQSTAFMNADGVIPLQ